MQELKSGLPKNIALYQPPYLHFQKSTSCETAQFGPVSCPEHDVLQNMIDI